MSSPERFCDWMSDHSANDNKFGRKGYRYHPRSDEHSKMLCRFVLDDLLAACGPLADHARTGAVVGGINAHYRFAGGKKKNLDLAIGEPVTPVGSGSTEPGSLREAPIGRLRIAVEAKQCMTEHSKTKPRLFDELSSSHEIVHQGDRNAIAAGIVVINMASRFASPLRQKTRRGPLVFTEHRQPDVSASMVEHLRGLVLREQADGIGFDAFATIVLDCDNVGECRLHVGAPAPQPGDRDHYARFIERISRAYAARFAPP